MSGCVRETVASCRSDVEVTFRYVRNMSGEDLFADQVRKVTLLVFDDRGVYLGSYTDQGAVLASPGYTMRLSLAPGTYTLLVWGGWMDTYDLNGLEAGVSTLGDFRLRANGLTVRGGGTLDVPGLDDLFHGLYGRLEVRAGQTTRAAIDLTKDTNTILVDVYGLEYLNDAMSAASAPSLFDVEVMADNGLYGIDNLPLRGEYMLRYLPGSNIYQDYTLASSIRMLRLILGDEVRLRIALRSSGRVIFDDNLIELIAANPRYATQSDIDRQDVFRFDYRISSAANVTISVNGWTVVDAIPLL